MQILVLLADGFEETEFVVPFDFWQRAGFGVTTASVSGRSSVTGSHGLEVQANTSLASVSASNFDAVFLPGGGLGVKNLMASLDVKKFVCEMNVAHKWIFAICAAPKVLSAAKLLVDRVATCFPGCETDLVCKEFSEERVVVDGNIVTSRGAGTAEEFAFECISLMGGEQLADKIRSQVVAR